MPFAKCPNCGETFHLSVGDVKAWYAEMFPGHIVGDVVPARCFGCWRTLQQYDIVKVVRPLEGNPTVQIGDTGAVVEILTAPNGDVGYMVENVRPDGGTRWLETFTRDDLKFVVNPKTP
jgi:hypothetical protein